nr:hypothetical protein [Actinomycetota bacterium]
MDTRQMAAMAEATRLTRQGRLAEATALIQQTLASPAVTRRVPEALRAEDKTGRTADCYPDPPPPLPSRGATQPERVPPGWIRPLRALPSRGAPGPDLAQRPAVPAAR